MGWAAVEGGLGWVVKVAGVGTGWVAWVAWEEVAQDPVAWEVLVGDLEDLVVLVAWVVALVASEWVVKVGKAAGEVVLGVRVEGALAVLVALVEALATEVLVGLVARVGLVAMVGLEGALLQEHRHSGRAGGFDAKWPPAMRTSLHRLAPCVLPTAPSKQQTRLIHRCMIQNSICSQKTKSHAVWLDVRPPCASASLVSKKATSINNGSIAVRPNIVGGPRDKNFIVTEVAPYYMVTPAYSFK